MKHITFIILTVLSVFFTSCFCVKKLPQSKLNPTEYVFPMSKKAMIDSLITKKDYYFSYQSKHYLINYMKDSDCVNLVFTNWEKNKYGGSYVYRKGDNGKNHSCDFKIRIDSLSSDSCRVKIIYVKGELCTPIVKIGDMWYIKYKQIPSTTIEEYEMLRKFGKRLNILNQMPLVNYPAGLTRNQILMTYGLRQEFTYEEMFGEPQPESEKERAYTEKELKKRKKNWLPPTKFNYW